MSSSSPIKGIIKRVKNSSILSFLIKNFIYSYLKLLFLTYRLEIQCDHKYEQPFNKNQGVFYFWHQNIIAATFFFFKNKSIGYCIISPSHDGKIMGFIAKKLGFKVLYGSGYKSSVKMVRQALDVLDANKKLCLVGDGSRGPAFKLQRGVIYFASKSKIPLVFIECKSEWAFTFNKSWDKFQVPLPFSKILVKIHEPVIPSSDAYKEFKKCTS
jgi:lysophospholipid acyltransferase (LPLAT)-like uncharacterized protein